MLRGRCLCEAVRFEVEDAFEYACYCHCSRCRRRSGAAFTAFGGIAAEKLRVTAGAGQLDKRGPSEALFNAFCSQCLSPLFAGVPGGRLHVQLGALEDGPAKQPDHHIFVGSKAPWYQIGDGLPQYAELPGGPAGE